MKNITAEQSEWSTIFWGMLGEGCSTEEALKYILGQGELLTNQLLTYDALNVNFRKVQFKPNPKCAVCGDNKTILEPYDEEQAVCDIKR